MSNSLDSEQARHIVEPYLGPNYFQRLSADNTSRQNVKLVINKRQCKSVGENKNAASHWVKLVCLI